MIKLTAIDSNKPIYVNPDQITTVFQQSEGETYIETVSGEESGFQVTESAEEVTRKVLEWRLAMERIKAALLTDKKEIAMPEYQNLKRLAGLEEPNND